MAESEEKTGEFAIADGEKLAFLGDSITAEGARWERGYCRLVLEAFQDQGIEIEPVFAGVSGNTSRDMLVRLEDDILQHQPDWLALSCGVNDVWQGEAGVELEAYKRNVTRMVTRAQESGIKVVILTATMIGEDEANALNRKLAPYNAFLKELAQEKGCLLADLNSAMRRALKPPPKKGLRLPQLTIDGVHMNFEGNIVLAKGVGEALGLKPEQLARSEKNWS